jgi:large subunit ribosomal protein L25
MDKIPLELQKRETVGKHNRALRRGGLTPAHLFGHGVESLSLQGPTTELEHVVSRAGTSHLINLKVKGERRSRSVLIREVQRKPVSGLLLHVDLYQVRSKEKMTVEVPVHASGVAPALESRVNTMVVELPVLTVECLPADLPARLDVDVSTLENSADVIRVGDVKPPDGVTILNDRELVVVRIEVERKKAPEVEETAEISPASEETPET